MTEVTGLDERLGAREERILLDLVAAYIRGRDPVSSRALAERTPGGPSSATVRTVLARLEDLGYLHQPHSVSGRIPTDLAYRTFAAAVLREEGGRAVNPSREEVERLAEDGTIAGVARGISGRLADSARLLAFAATPHLDEMRLRTCDLVSLSPERVLFVLVSQAGQVTERVLRSPRPVGADTLRWCANFLTQTFAGCTLPEIRRRLAREVEAERERCGQEIAGALELVAPCFAETPADRGLYWEGAPWLLESSLLEEEGVDAIRILLQTLERKTRLLELLEALRGAEGPVRVVLGEDWGDPQVRTLAMVVAPFGGDATVRGYVGIVGPRPMPYETAIPAVRDASVLATLAAEAL
jgi:heat-inducible transcriptional repressor